MVIPPYFLVFDVESVGLGGEVFAIGLVVVDATGTEHHRRLIACRPEDAMGSEEDRAWVAINVPDLRQCAYAVETPSDVVGVFWSEWMAWRSKGAVLISTHTDPHRERREHELPRNNPLADARQFARLMIESLKAKAFP